jgi:putative salt-induced outer membrane protein YdiY
VRSCAALLILLATTFARADLVIMDNGDQYSGRVTGMSSGTLQLTGDFGQWELPWSRIAELTTDQPLALTLDSGTRMIGTLVVENGMARFTESELAELALPTGKITYMGAVDKPDLQVEGRINVGLAALRGNTRSDSYHTNGEYIARAVRNRFRLAGQANYASERGTRTENNAALSTTYDHFVNARWYFNSNFGLARDEFKDLDLRTTAGVGLGYQFRDQPRDRLAVELGVSYIREDYDDADDEDQPAVRYALNFLRRLAIGPTLFHRHELLASLKDSDYALLQTETGVRLALMRHVTGTMQINFDYDWQPAPDARHRDVAYLLTLGYEF